MRERERAEKWWAEAGREEAKCDICSKAVRKGEGYLVDSFEILHSRFWGRKVDQISRIPVSPEDKLRVWAAGAESDWLLCRECFLGYKADGELMVSASGKLDELHLRIMERIRREEPIPGRETTQIADIRDYFMYLTLDGMGDPDLARRLVRIFTELEGRSKTHGKFFFTLSQILSLRHGIREIPLEKVSREDFERSWRRTRRELGI